MIRLKEIDREAKWNLFWLNHEIVIAQNENTIKIQHRDSKIIRFEVVYLEESAEIVLLSLDIEETCFLSVYDLDKEHISWWGKIEFYFNFNVHDGVLEVRIK